MPLEMVFNELSLQTTDDIYVARDWMSTFIQTVRQATSHGMSRVIRTQSDFFDIRLASDYPLRRWLNDGDVDKETRL
jgi:hypothetical protein